MDKPHDNRAWLLVTPVLAIVAFSAVIPLMTVVNYSVQDILGPDQRTFVGSEWFQKVLRDPELHGAFGRQLIFSLSVLLIEIPRGTSIASTDKENTNCRRNAPCSSGSRSTFWNHSAPTNVRRSGPRMSCTE